MSLSDADKIVAYIEARVRPTICPTYSSAGTQSIEGRITRDDFDHLIGLVQSLRASQAKVVEALRSLVAKLDECEGPITAVCAMAAVRGFPYRGPNYKAELAAACTVLAEHGGQT